MSSRLIGLLLILSLLYLSSDTLVYCSFLWIGDGIVSYDDITASVLLYLGTPVALLFVCSHVYVHTSSAKCSTVVYAFGYYVVYPRSSVVTGGSSPQWHPTHRGVLLCFVQLVLYCCVSCIIVLTYYTTDNGRPCCPLGHVHYQYTTLTDDFVRRWYSIHRHAFVCSYYRLPKERSSLFPHNDTQNVLPTSYLGCPWEMMIAVVPVMVDIGQCIQSL